MQHTEKASAHSGETVKTTGPRRTQLGDLFTFRHPAEYWGCSEATVRNRTMEGSLKAVRMGPRMIRIRRDDLDAILQPYDAGQAGSWAHLR
jgi:excisionase family DNA binding protein